MPRVTEGYTLDLTTATTAATTQNNTGPSDNALRRLACLLLVILTHTQ